MRRVAMSTLHCLRKRRRSSIRITPMEGMRFERELNGDFEEGNTNAGRDVPTQQKGGPEGPPPLFPN